MCKIAIIGAGQSGLQLGIGLLKSGYYVSIFSDRSADEIANGSVLSSPALFNTSLDNERALGLHLWEDTSPQNKTISFTIASDSTKIISWLGNTSHYYQAVDQRIKIPAWISVFEALGGDFNVEAIEGIDRLEELSSNYNLVIIATGKGNLGKLFETDTAKCQFTTPQRKLALTYVNNVIPAETSGVKFNCIPGIGEFFTMPGLTKNGFCEMMLFEGMLDGPLDCWDKVASPEQQLTQSKNLLQQYLPWEAERFKFAELTDKYATLRGAYAPTVRKPVLRLPSGKVILGMGDAVVLNDPISGQGANTANKAATIYLTKIKENLSNSFDEQWMQKTFDEFWDYGKYVTQWTNMLLAAPKPHVVGLMHSASQCQPLADKLADLFDNPPSLFPWIEEKSQTEAFISTYTHRQSTQSSLSDKLYLLSNAKGFGLDGLLKRNEQYLKDFSNNNALMQFISSEKANYKQNREQLLDAIQTFSDYFQKVVMLRRAFSDNPLFTGVAQEHLEEEFNHNYKLLKDRDYQPPQWDPVLESACSWFTWKMFTLNDTGKTLIVHLVLEASANVFFTAADKVMKKFGETEYFSDHAELDEAHEQMGINLLKGLPEYQYDELMKIQQQGWDILNLACQQIAKIAMTDAHEPCYGEMPEASQSI